MVLGRRYFLIEVTAVLVISVLPQVYPLFPHYPLDGKSAKDVYYVLILKPAASIDTLTTPLLPGHHYWV
jgi:hypothetical protein